MQDLNMQWDTATQLQVEVAFDALRCTVRLSGELDMATAPQLRDALDLVCRGGHRLVVIDLAELRFLGLTGLRTLVDTQHTLQAAGCRLVLAHPDAVTARVLAITGLDQAFPSTSATGLPDAGVAIGNGPVVIA